MEQTREKSAQNLAERVCWYAARRDDSRVAQRLYREQVGGMTGLTIDDPYGTSDSLSAAPLNVYHDAMSKGEHTERRDMTRAVGDAIRL
jgi:hypothetical protein